MSRCIDACPAKAANGKPWSINVKREDFLNPFACRDKCRELTKKNFNEEISICGICISVCPIGEKI